MSGRKVAVKGTKRLKWGRKKLFYKSLVKLIENMITALPDVYRCGRFPWMLPVFKTKMAIKVVVRALSETLGFSNYPTLQCSFYENQLARLKFYSYMNTLVHLYVAVLVKESEWP
jgi:hypothetical protein